MKNVTKDSLSEMWSSTFYGNRKYYNLVQTRPAKKVSKTELKVYSEYEDETDLEPYSVVLVYGKNIPHNKNEHNALIKLIKRGWFQIYKVEKETCEKYPTGFTYILKKESKS